MKTFEEFIESVFGPMGGDVRSHRGSAPRKVGGFPTRTKVIVGRDEVPNSSVLRNYGVRATPTTGGDFIISGESLADVESALKTSIRNKTRLKHILQGAEEA